MDKNWGWAILDKTGDIAAGFEEKGVDEKLLVSSTLSPQGKAYLAGLLEHDYPQNAQAIDAIYKQTITEIVNTNTASPNVTAINAEQQLDLQTDVNGELDSSENNYISDSSSDKSLSMGSHQISRNMLALSDKSNQLEQHDAGLEGNLPGSERKMKVDIGAEGKLRAEIDGNLWGGKDQLQIETITRGKDGSIEQATGRMQMDTPVGKIDTNWTYNSKDSDGFRDLASKWSSTTGDVKGFDKLLTAATGVVQQESEDGQTRRVLMGRDDKGNPTALAVEHLDKDGNGVLMVYNDKNSKGPRTGEIYTKKGDMGETDPAKRKDTGKYALAGHFSDGPADNKKIQEHMAQVLAATKDPKIAAALRAAISGVSQVHTETDLEGNITREIAFDAHGRVAYAMDTQEKQLLVFKGNEALKFTNNALASNGVTKTDITNLVMAMPYTGAGDTANAVQQLVGLQEKADTLGVIAAKTEAAAQVSAKGRMENKNASGLGVTTHEVDSKIANSFGPMLERLGFSKDQINQATTALAYHLDKLTSDPASPLGLLRTGLE